MSEFWTLLRGKKTYIAGAIATILGILQSEAFLSLDVIPESWQKWIAAIAIMFGGLTVAAYRASQAKVEESQEEVADEFLKHSPRRSKLTAAKKPKPRSKVNGTK